MSLASFKQLGWFSAKTGGPRPDRVPGATPRTDNPAVRLAGPVAVAAAFSAVISILMLAGPVFLLQIYDRVLPSRSVESLVSLFGLTTAIYVAAGYIDHARTQILARLAARYQDAADRVLFAAFRPAAPGQPDKTAPAIRDAEAVRQFLASPALPALFDLPFAPLFLAAIFALHADLGWVAAGGMAVIVAVTVRGHLALSRSARITRSAAASRDELSADLARFWPDLAGLGMISATRDRWLGQGRALRDEQVRLADVAAGHASVLKSFRLILQSALMAYGAWIVLRDGTGAGALMAASILSGRALAPVDQLSAHWPALLRALTAWRRLDPVLHPRAGNHPRRPAASDAEPAGTVSAGVIRLRSGTPAIGAQDGLACTGLTLPWHVRADAGTLSFTVPGGRSLAVIGPSGAGKSTLLRILAGAVPLPSGHIAFRGLPILADPDDSDPPLTGYLPQGHLLLSGTLAENIARFRRSPDRSAVTRAAQLAGMHDAILRLADGYDTRVGGDACPLSGGQGRLLSLARALYGDPVLLLLDEPFAHLDQNGCNAVRAAVGSVTARGGVVVMTGHAVATASGCDHTLALLPGGNHLFGHSADILQRLTGQPTPNAAQNHRDGMRS